MKLFRKLFKKAKKPTPVVEYDYNLVGDFSMTSITGPTFAGTVTVPAIPATTSYSIGASSYSVGSFPISPGVTFTSPVPPSILTIMNDGKEIVTLTKDGRVEWADGIRIDEASESFAKALTISSELVAGIDKRVKSDMRNSVFNDLISIAKDKGSLTADDLTYLLEASKIMEKLKGKE